MRQNSHVKNMQRVPHIHRSAVKDVKINGRYVCDDCPYRWPRPKSLGTKRPMYNLETQLLLEVTLPHQTVPELKAMLLKANPDTKGISKMRKPELVSALLDLVK